MEPLLFGTIGTSIVFSRLQQTTIPKAVLIVLTGEEARCAFLPFRFPLSTSPFLTPSLP